MSMKKYIATERFTMSVLNNPALTMGLTVKVGDVIYWDGFNVDYNGIKDASLLQPTINAGWLRLALEGEGEGEQEGYSVPPIQRGEAPVPDMYESVVKTSVPSQSNNGQTIIMSGSSVMKKANVETVEGHTVRKTSFADAGSNQSSASQVSTERQRLGVVMDDDFEMVTPLKNREGVSKAPETSGNTSGMIKKTAQRTVVGGSDEHGEYFEMDSEAIPMSRKVPAKVATEVNAKTSTSEAGIEHLANVGSRGKTLEARDVVHHDGENLGVASAPSIRTKTSESSSMSPQQSDMSLTKLDSSTVEQKLPPIRQKTQSSGINERERKPREAMSDFEKQKADATARLKAKREGTLLPVEEAVVEAEEPGLVFDLDTPEEVAVKKAAKKAAKKPATKKDAAPAKGAKKVATKKLPKAALSGDALVDAVVVDGVQWADLNYKLKEAATRTFKDATLLEAIRLHKKSHHTVRKAATETLASLA